nr:DUF5359 family protein [Paenibacillus bovis]
MKTVERIIFKILLIQLLILVIVQTYIHRTPVIDYLNKVYLYEGVMDSEEQPKLDVFNNKE